MYVCLHCGHRFTNPVKYQYNKSVRMYDEDAACPNCGSEDFEQAGHCIKCGKDFPLDEMVGSICKECVEKAQTFDNALKYGNDRKSTVELNGFIAYAFSASEINEILANVLKLANERGFKDAANFCGDDLHDFSEWLEGQDE